MAQLRCGTAPIHLETGRYENIVVDDRLCPLRKSGIEDELHVILECPEYDVVRRELFDKLLVDIDGILCYSKKQILKTILKCDNQSLVKVKCGC